MRNAEFPARNCRLQQNHFLFITRTIHFVHQNAVAVPIIQLGIVLPFAVHLRRARASHIQTLQTLHWVFCSCVPCGLVLIGWNPILLVDSMFRQPTLLLSNSHQPLIHVEP